ncbi:MAG: MBL fold metallo-hydrolase, partial [Ilumatobacteraceae bacterium]
MNIRSTPLDALTVTVVVDNETDNLSSIDAGIPQLPEVVSLLKRIPPTRQLDGHDCIPVFDHLCVACHGLSVLLIGVAGTERHAVLFDVGPYGDVWVDNARRLGIDISIIETVFLSHWHWDHSGGFPVAISAITKARRETGLDAPVVVDLHPDRPDQRGIRTPSGTVVMLPEEPTLVAL